MSNKKIEDLPSFTENIKHLEQEKIKAEIARIKAQEALIRDKISTKWYEESSILSQFTRAIFQGIATVLIGVPVLWFYVENVVKPSVEVRVLESRKHNLEEEIELNQRIQDVNESLRNAQASHTQTKAQLEKANQDLEQSIERLRVVRAELEQLKTVNVPPAFNETLDSATNQINSAEQAIDTLQQSVQAESRNAENRIEETNQLQDQLNIEQPSLTPVTPES
ncbi:hypothetical protein PN498_17095 [Oscillatoria sp. CS-180]|uniref:hypothetical protein n=1 Tax=Oscillatoria sp. CS-180 TaxID=3021720 RepID=UPI0023302F7C|nr:hypothetical protein [Oscillatoria sp. CS-180]MDB9527714.1 hypothetical protein [Oscillatoria sp. CS-180]